MDSYRLPATAPLVPATPATMLRSLAGCNLFLVHACTFLLLAQDRAGGDCTYLQRN